MTPPAASHRVTTDALGAPVLVKRMEGSEGRTRLVGEAAVLRALDHPGTVRVVDLVENDDGAELHLAWVGPHSLATVTGVPAAEAGRLVAGVAEVVADLHRAGVVHRRLTPDHVLLGPDGGAVLTGLAEAVGDGRADPAEDVAALAALLTGVVAPAEEPTVIPDRRRRRGRDSGLRGALLTLADVAASDDPDIRLPAAELAARLRATVEPVAARRGRNRHRAQRSGALRPPSSATAATPVAASAAPRPQHSPAAAEPPGPERAVTSGDDQAQPPPPPPPPAPAPAASAGVLGPPRSADDAARARRFVRPAAAPADTERPRPGRDVAPAARRGPSSRRSRRRHPRVLRRRLSEVPPGRRVAVVVLVLAAIGTLVAAATLGSDPSTQVATATLPATTNPPAADADGGPRPPDPPSPSPGGVVPPSTSAPSVTAPGGACPAVPASPAADIDGDGCPDALRIEDQRISADGTTWIIGRPGDALAVADWDCDGTATVASLRPSTGEVFIFERWVTSGDELTVPAATTLPWADSLRAVDDDGDGCAQLTAVGDDGRTVTVPTGSLR